MKRSTIFGILAVLAVAVLAMVCSPVDNAQAQTVPTWIANGQGSGAYQFYTTTPADHGRPSMIQITAQVDTMRVSFQRYESSSWNDVLFGVAYGDTNLAIAPGETVVLHFRGSRQPDICYFTPTGSATARLWAE